MKSPSNARPACIVRYELYITVGEIHIAYVVG